MTVWEIFAEYDRQCAILGNSELEKWLSSAYESFKAENPQDLVGQCALLNELGGFYRGRGIYDKGEQVFLTAKSLLESLGGTDSIDYATTLNNLAGLYRLTGDLDKALSMFDESQALYEKNEKDAPPELYASCFNNKGLVYQDMEKYDDARVCFERALSLINDLPNNGYVIATTLSNIAFASVGLKDMKKAELSINKAAEIFRDEMGEDSPIYQSCLRAKEKLLNAGK